MMYCRKWQTNWTNWQPISTQQLANASKGMPLPLHDIDELYESTGALERENSFSWDALGPTPPIIADYKVQSNVCHPCGPPPFLQRTLRKIIVSLFMLFVYLSVCLSVYLFLSLLPPLLSPFSSNIRGGRPTIAKEKSSGYEGKSPQHFLGDF